MSVLVACNGRGCEKTVEIGGDTGTWTSRLASRDWATARKNMIYLHYCPLCSRVKAKR